MASLTSDQVGLTWFEGTCERSALFSLKAVTAGDTLDVGTWFKGVKRGGVVSATGTTIGAVTIAGTTLTIPAGPTADGLWLLVVGVSA